MKVLKFGGTSVGSAKNIQKVIEIVKNESLSENVSVVVSAIGGITDRLLAAADKAVQKNKKYKVDFESIRLKHIEVIDGLLSEEAHQTTLDIVLNHLSKLEKILDGIYLINEMSPKTTDKLLSFGELLSSLIIYETMKLQDFNIQLKNSQNLIVTDSNFTSNKIPQIQKLEQTDLSPFGGNFQLTFDDFSDFTNLSDVSLFLYKKTQGIINAICNGLETKLGTKPEKIKKIWKI